MRTVQLGDTGLQVSALCLGCMNFGTRTSKEDAYALLDTYWDAGGRFLDTANNYAFWEPGGHGGESETLLGDWLLERGCRDEAIVATKVGALPRKPGRGLEDAEGLSTDAIRRAVEASLRRLRIERVDLCYAHIMDPLVSAEETMGVWADLVQAGKVRFIGSSNHTLEALDAAQAAAHRAGTRTYCALQQRHSYLQPDAMADFGVQRTVTPDLRERCLAESDVTVVAYGALLGGVYSGGPIPDGYSTAENRQRLARLKAVASEIGATAGQLALAALSADEMRTIPLVAASRPERLRESLASVDLRLTREVLSRLD